MAFFQKLPASSPSESLSSSGGGTVRACFLGLLLRGGGLSTRSRDVEGPGTDSSKGDPGGITLQ